MIELTPQELKEKLSSNSNFVLIDVREEYEYEDENIGGVNIPLAEVLDQINDFNEEQNLVFCCKSGKRSQAIAHTVERKTNRNNVFTLEGGIDNYLSSGI